MTHEEAIQAAQSHLNLVGKKFKLPDGETETIKAVVAWEEGQGKWEPHVCFYDWEKNEDGEVLHLNLDKFFKTYSEVS